jgi:3-dehydroquinate dehydratase type I
MFRIRSGEDQWSVTERDCARLVSRTANLDALTETTLAPPRAFGALPSFFVCLTFADVRDHVEVIQTLCAGANAIELRVDLLACADRSFVSNQVAVVRRLSDLPIIFTVRTVPQGGSFAYDPACATDREDLLSLLLLGIRLGCAFIDVEFKTTTESMRARLYAELRKRRRSLGWSTQLICSDHCYQDSYLDAEIAHLFRSCADQDRADVIKVVTRASNIADVHQLARVCVCVCVCVSSLCVCFFFFLSALSCLFWLFVCWCVIGGMCVFFLWYSVCMFAGRLLFVSVCVIVVPFLFVSLCVVFSFSLPCLIGVVCSR